MRTLALLLLLAPMLLIAQRKDTIADRPLSTAMLLAEGRLTLRLPEPARSERVAGSGGQYAERITVEVGDDRLVLVCTDLQALASQRLMEDWKQMIDPAGEMYRFKRTSGEQGVSYITHDPYEGLVTDVGELLLGALLDLGPAGLVRVDGHVDRKAAARSDSYKGLLRRIFEQAAHGPETLAETRRTVKLALTTAGDSLALVLPAGYRVASEVEKGGVIHRIAQPRTLDATSRPMLLVQVGEDLRPRAGQLDLTEAMRSDRVGQLFQRPITWSSYVDPDGALQLIEHQMPVVTANGSSMVQVAIIGTDAADMEELVAIAQGLHLP